MLKSTHTLSGALLVITLILSTTVLAGGSIFGGHKTRTSNPNGVTSIGAYICSDLDCSPVRVINAKNMVTCLDVMLMVLIG